MASGTTCAADKSQLSFLSHRENGGDWWVTTSHLTRMSHFGWENKGRSEAEWERGKDVSPFLLFPLSVDIKNLILYWWERVMNFYFSLLWGKNQANRCQPSLPQSWYSLTHAIFKHFKHYFPYCAKTVRNGETWIQVVICSHVLQYHSAMTAASNGITEAIIILSIFICMCTGWSHL